MEKDIYIGGLNVWKTNVNIFKKNLWRIKSKQELEGPLLNHK